jgi:hypothetical protein
MELDTPVSSAAKIVTKSQPINTSPPWWNGNVSIDFSTDEWRGILSELRMLYEIPTFPENDHDLMLINIMDRIQKGIEIQ